MVHNYYCLTRYHPKILQDFNIITHGRHLCILKKMLSLLDHNLMINEHTSLVGWIRETNQQGGGEVLVSKVKGFMYGSVTTCTVIQQGGGLLAFEGIHYHYVYCQHDMRSGYNTQPSHLHNTQVT